MGLIAFVLLILAELLLSLSMGYTVYSFFYALIHSNQQRIGLLAQMMFGAFPLVEYCWALDHIHADSQTIDTKKASISPKGHEKH